MEEVPEQYKGNAAQTENCKRHFREIGYQALILASLLYGCSVIVARVLTPQVPPLALAAARSLLGLAVLAPLVWRKRTLVMPRRSDLPFLALLGFFGMAVAYSTFSWGMRESQAINAAVIFAASPAVTNALLAVGWRVKPTRTQIFGIITALTGLLLVITHGSVSRLLGLTFRTVDLILLANVLTVAFYNILGQRVMQRFSPLVTCTYSLFFGTLYLLPFGVWEVATQGWHFSWQGWLMLLYMGCVISGLAVLLSFVGISRIGSGPAAIFSNLNPVFTIVLATLLLGEQLTPYHGLGIILVLTGVGVSLLPSKVDFKPRKMVVRNGKL